MPSRSSSQGSSTKTEPAAPASPRVQFSGIGVSAGIAIGKALVVGRDVAKVIEIELRPEDVQPEVARFRAAIDTSLREIQQMRDRVAKILGDHDARIFDAHLLLIQDSLLLDEVTSQIAARRRNAEFVFRDVVARYTKALGDVQDAYIRDRLTDITDVANRVIANLCGSKPVDLAHLTAPCILVADDLSPSDTATLDRANVLGFAAAQGSRTSHTAIMARAMGIPALVGVAGARETVRTGDTLILDGSRGLLLVNPGEDVRRDYRARVAAQAQWYRNVEAEAALPAETLDGFRVQLAANIELPSEVAIVKQSCGVGIGLFRTEYLFINRTEIPSEQEQFEAYRRAAEDIYPQSVILRTLDLGGDKFMSTVRTASDMNPFLGVRAIRFCLARPDIFRSQLRAILRASAFGKVRIMFPMIATLEELTQALACFGEAKRELAAEGVAFNRRMDVGTMIEVPSAALIADQLARHVDFFSVGTNDLVQYSLAVDRSNPTIAYLYQPCHPSILRLVGNVLEAAWAHGKWVSMCGEMAADPVYTPLVLGLGIHELSMSPVAIGSIKHLVRHMRLHEAERLVGQALACGTAEEVHKLCEAFVQRVSPELLAALEEHSGRRRASPSTPAHKG